MMTAVLERVRTQAAQAQVHPFGACLRCDHHAVGTCTHTPHAPQSVGLARSRTGPCGPDAALLRTNGWDYR